MTRKKEIYKVTLVGSVGNLLLLTFKFVAGILSGSSAMVADALHSLSDFATDMVVLAFVRVSSRPEDASHDYGHGKFETVASFLIGLALVAVAVGVIVAGSVKLSAWLGGAALASPGVLAWWAAVVSVVVKELLYRYTERRGKALNSQVMIANAWHHRSDALSSVAAAIGIGGAILGGERWAVLDPLASIVVGAMLVKVAWDLLKSNVDELTEGSLSEATETEILRLIAATPGVEQPHNLRTRRIGDHYAIEVHVCMDGSMPLSEAHDKASMIEQGIRARFGQQTHVTIHMEPR